MPNVDKLNQPEPRNIDPKRIYLVKDLTKLGVGSDSFWYRLISNRASGLRARRLGPRKLCVLGSDLEAFFANLPTLDAEK